jgi:hypothetical protein
VGSHNGSAQILTPGSGGDIYIELGVARAIEVASEIAGAEMTAPASHTLPDHIECIITKFC